MKDNENRQLAHQWQALGGCQPGTIWVDHAKGDNVGSCRLFLPRSLLLPIPDAGFPDVLSGQWFATDGRGVLGPLAFSDIALRVQRGLLSSRCVLRHGRWRGWVTFQQLQDLGRAALEQTVEQLAEDAGGAAMRLASATGERLAIRPSSYPPPPASARTRPLDVTGVLSTTERLDQTLMLGLALAALSADSSVGRLHRLRGDQDEALTEATFGQEIAGRLGELVVPEDPVRALAEAGQPLLCGAAPNGAAGAMVRRLSTQFGDLGCVAMIPLLVEGGLVAWVELGKRNRMSARELGRVEEVVEALAARCLVMGWLG
jgi:hypothetical protein